MWELEDWGSRDESGAGRVGAYKGYSKQTDLAGAEYFICFKVWSRMRTGMQVRPRWWGIYSQVTRFELLPGCSQEQSSRDPLCPHSLPP